MKSCSSCKRELELSRFYRNRVSRDGLNYSCKDCNTAGTKRWRGKSPTYRADEVRRATARNKANPERTRAASKRFRDANKPRLSEYFAAYQAANRAVYAANQRKWHKANPLGSASYRHRRRAKEAAALGACSASQLAARVEIFGGRCWICAAQATAIDHVKPLRAGGSNWPANLRPICKSCNSAKGAQWAGTAAVGAIIERILGRKPIASAVSATQ